MELLKNFSNSPLEADCDEADGGCIASPVVAALVTLNANFKQNLVNDS